MNSLNTFLWNCIFLPGVFLCGGILSLGTSTLHIRRFGLSMRLTLGKAFEKNSGEGLSPLQAASTALASTVGTGNIVGTAQAIAMGGPGALFWLWVTALFGMIIKYAEIFLSLKYRVKTESGWRGGPMYYIRKGLGSRFAPMASAYAAFAALSALGMGNMAQMDACLSAIEEAAKVFTHLSAGNRLLVRLVPAIILAVPLWKIMAGGAKRVGKITEILVPVMSLIFLMVSLVVLICHAQKLPGVLKEVICCALSPKAALGAAGGISVKEAMHWGIRRSAFSNEAGLGSSAIAHAAADTDDAFAHSMWGIFEVFADTVVICSATALVILCSGVSVPWHSAPGPELLQAAFSTVFGAAPSAVFMALSMLLFGYATVIGWSLYGMQCSEYLFGSKGRRFFSLVYPVCTLFSSIMSTGIIWTLSDTANALMAVPNLAALLLLSDEVCKMIKSSEKFQRKFLD